MNADQYYKQITDLCSLDVKAVHKHYVAHLITDKGDMAFDEVEAIDITRDFANGFTDNTVLTVKMKKSFYIDVLYPVRNDFRIKLIGTQVSEKETGMRIISPIVTTETFTGILINPIDYGNETESNSNTMSTEDQNADTQLISVNIQIMKASILELSNITFGGLFNGVPGDVLKMMLSEPLKSLEFTKDGVPSGVTMVPHTENSKKSDIVIPHGTRLIELPRIIQKDWYGIYNKGIGSYITPEQWYVYPLYDFTRYDKERTKLTVSILPKSRTAGLTRTYHVSNREVNVIGCGDVKVIDDTNVKTLNDGAGVTYYDTSELKQDTTTKTADGVFVKNQKAKKQVFGQGRKDNLNFASYAKEKLSSSLSDALSKVAANNSMVITVTWDHANPWLLAPGMATRVVFFKGGKKYSVMGTLAKVAGLIQPEGGPSLKRHVSSAALAIIVDQSSLSSEESKHYSSKSNGVKGSLFNKILDWF